MKIYCFVLFLLLELVSMAQDSVQWNLKYVFKLPEHASWTTDHFGQLYVTQKDLIKKYDAKSNLLFEQSFKKYGQIAEIDTKNPMKILLFSEQQQLIYYVDNTLTKHAVELDLSEYGFSYVTHVEGSVQPDKIWVFDQENSKISLLATKEQQSLRTHNTGGLVNFSTITKIVERNEYLYVIDLEKGLFQFDLYGTLVNQFPLPAYDYLQIEGFYAYLLSSDRLQIINLETQEQKLIPLPKTMVLRFEIKQNRLFLESEGQIFHYLVELF